MPISIINSYRRVGESRGVKRNWGALISYQIIPWWLTESILDGVLPVWLTNI
jgi:hypothetical protein